MFLINFNEFVVVILFCGYLSETRSQLVMCLFLNFEQGVKDKANKEIASQQTYVLSTWSCVKQDNE